MAEKKRGIDGGSVGSGCDGGSGGDESLRLLTSFEKFGDRQKFTVELRPEETTIVSWKKLIRDANKVNESRSLSIPDPPPALESRIAPGKSTETELQDPAAPHRFGAVIEKIERLYMGKDSSDEEEDLDDIPNDDQYDTEDSFIDDVELDDYFQVDNSAIKHDGFFVNKGKLERVEPTPLPDLQPKKKRKNVIEKHDVHLPKEHVKVAKTTASVKSLSMSGKNASDASQCLPQQNKVVGYSEKNLFDIKSTMEQSFTMKGSKGDDTKDPEKQKTRAISQSKNTGNKVKDTSGPGPSNSSLHHKYLEKNCSSQPKTQLGSVMNGVKEIDLSLRPKERNDIRGQLDVDNSASKHSIQVVKTSSVHNKDGSSVRPKSKGSSLEKAIKELEKMVAESRPSTMEVQVADTSSQAVKKRLPPEIKQKLAKVARLAACHGKVTTELIDRLMSIVGHFMQLRTLKRNLRIMINTGLAAKQTQDERFRQKKKEVTEIINTWVASNEFEQQAGESDDFQEYPYGEKGTIKRKCIIDNALEDKISELYDLYVNGLEEDVGPQIQKVYVELAELWPNGCMDNRGIQRAICNAKDRKRALHYQLKDQEKMKRNNLLIPKVEDLAQAKANTTAQTQLSREKLPIASTSHGIAVPNKPSNTAMPNQVHSSTNDHSSDRIIQEKVKVSSSNSLDELRSSNGALVKKKLKRKPEDFVDGHFRPTKVISRHGDEKQKSYKQSNLPPAPPNLEQLT